MSIERRSRQWQRCPHPDWTVRTRNFGLERSLCVRCGLMEMRNLPDEPVVLADSLRAAAARR